MATTKEAAIIQALMPLAVLLIALIIIKKFFGGAFTAIGQAATDAGQAVDLGDKVGIMKNATQQATAKSAKQFIDYYTQHPAQNPFLSSYFREYHDRQKYVGKLTLADVEQLVKNIYESDGFMTYKPEQFQKVFEFCKAKIEVAYIAQVFESEHGSLWNFMTTNYFNTSSRKEAALLSVFRYVNALPVGR